MVRAQYRPLRNSLETASFCLQGENGTSAVVADRGDLVALRSKPGYGEVVHFKEAVMPRMLSRPSPSLVISCTALLVALGGTGYATVLQVPRNSVGSLQLQRNAVKPSKIAPNAVRTAHVLDSSLLAADFKAGQLPSGQKGEKGEKGDKGAKGDKGDKGDPGLSGYSIVQGTTVSTTNAFQAASATCPAGKRPLGGGGFTQTPGAGVSIRNSFPTGQTWLVVVEAKTPGAGWNYLPHVVCATVAP
jgi:hypothetical protein